MITTAPLPDSGYIVLGRPCPIAVTLPSPLADGATATLVLGDDVLSVPLVADDARTSLTVTLTVAQVAQVATVSHVPFQVTTGSGDALVALVVGHLSRVTKWDGKKPLTVSITAGATEAALALTSANAAAVAQAAAEAAAAAAAGASDAGVAALVGSGPLTSAALSSTYGTVRQARFGRTSGRHIGARISGRTSAGATVTTPLTQSVTTPIPLAEVRGVNGVKVVTDGLQILGTDRWVEYDVTISADFSGGGAGSRRVGLFVNGADPYAGTWAYGYGSAARLTVTKTFTTRFNGGDTLTLRAWTDATGASVLADLADTVSLTIRRRHPLSVEPTISGWSGDDPTGLEGLNEIKGYWLNRASWAQIQAGSPLHTSGTAHAAWVAAHPTRAVEIGVPLIPTESGQSFDAMMDEAIAGTHDADYTGLGVALATYGPAAGAVYARPWWEFNLNTMNPTPAKFVAAWDRAVPLIRAGFASVARPGQSLKIVWCFAGQSQDPLPWWPNSSNVDIISMDSYLMKWGTSTPTLDAAMSEVNKDVIRLCTIAASKDKPLAISEWGAYAVKTGGTTQGYGVGDAPEHVDFFFDWIEQSAPVYVVRYNLPNVTGQTFAETPLALARFIERRRIVSRI